MPTSPMSIRPIPINIDRCRLPTARLRRGLRSLLGLFLVATGLFFGLPAGVADALDANRTLTQCLHRIWQVQQGLPRATIFSIRQTQDGYLWVGTQTGLMRFDGVHFKSIQESGGVSLENIWIHDMCEDHEHQLWIATEGAGLIRIGPGSTIQFRRADGLPSENVRGLICDRQGNVWAGTDAGLAMFAEGKFTTYGTVDGMASSDVQALCEAQDGSIWAGGSGNELSVRSGGKFSSRRLAPLGTYGAVDALLCTRDGAMWAGTSRGLIRLKDGQEKRFTTVEGLADDQVLCLAEGREGSVWVGTKDGFSRIEPDEIESFRSRDGLSQSTVHTLCEDHEGSLWVGTKHGLNQFLDRRTIPFTVSEGLPSNETGPVLQDDAGNLWVGTLGSGLARFDGRRFSALTTKDGLCSNTIYSLAGGTHAAGENKPGEDRKPGEGRDAELWIGTDRGLCRMRGGRVDKTYTKEQGLPSDTIRCLCRDRRGNLWAGTSAGLAELRGDRFAQPEGDAHALRLPIVALVDHGGAIFAAAEDGALYRSQNGQFASYVCRGAPCRDVDAFHEDADGLLWMGTHGGGLRLLDGDHASAYSLKDGLYDDDIFGLVADGEDRLWMACSKGIFFVTRSELRDFTAGKVKTLASTTFSPTDAQRTVECKDGVQPGVWIMRDGRVWFSTIRGLIVVDPAHFKRSLPPAPVVIEEVIVNGRNELPQQVAHLPPGASNLEFRYTALSLLIPTRTTFRYKLDGFDRDWVEAGTRREAFYTNLPPGSYQFRVAARNVNGNYNEAVHPVAFTLTPRFYQTVWFLPACLGAIALAVWFAYRMRVRGIKEKLHVVVAERSRIARELHDTLMQGFSGVTMEMQALSARLPASEERRTLEEIIRDAGVCLREARRSVAGLRSPQGEVSGLSTAIEQAMRQLTETRDVRLNLRLATVPFGLPPDVEYNLLRIAQEAVANAVKHSGGRTIDVDLDCAGGKLRLEIRDDGVGYVAPDGNPAQPGHYGLIGMRERANQIGADFHLTSEPGRGTTVCVTLPLTTPRQTPTTTGVASIASPSEQ
jgi:signal transduction histidine kinase/ligand-binding sensor domain-containing protein